MFGTIKGTTVAMFSLYVGIFISGCNVDGHWVRAPQNPSRKEARSLAKFASRPAGADEGTGLLVTDVQEVDLVEAVLSHREEYRGNLKRLHDYYLSHGYTTRQAWAAFELNGLRRVKHFRYLLDAEIPSDSLRPTEQIPEADALYELGLDLMRRGGHGVPGIYREDRMIEAADVFRELIERYPSSEKIDDAAFYCGEIHKEYLPGQELIAVKWYERAWEWNPDTTHPARFQAAVVYDYSLHDRDRALELYQNVVEHETNDKSNVRFAARRIRELTTDDVRTRQANRR